MPRVHAGNERRRFNRVAYDVPALLSDTDSRRSWPVRIIDLSLHGCLLKASKDLTVRFNTLYELTIHLSESVEIRMNLSLVRSTPEHIGFRCTHIDLNSISELRRLVELNLGDSSLLDRDLDALTAV